MRLLTSTPIALCALLAGASVCWGAPPEGAETEESGGGSSSFPVEFRGQILFQISAPLGRLTPAERAAAIARRLSDIASGPPSAAASVRALDRADRVDVITGEHLILSVTDADAQPTGRTRRQLAADETLITRGALERDFHDRSIKGLAFGLVYSVVATAVLLLVLWGFALGFRRIYVFLLRASVTRLGARSQLFGVGGLGEILRAVARLVRVLLSAIVLYLYVNLTLSFFPWSRGLAHQLFLYLESAALWAVHGLVAYLPNLVYIVIILFITRYFVMIARLIFDALDRGGLKVSGFYRDWALPTFKIVRFLIFAFAAVLVFPYLPGASSPAFKGISVFLGILFSLGSASSVGNMISGVVLTYMRPFHVGDRVKVADTIGDVVGKNLLVVRVRTIKNVEVTIPNAIVLANHIINYSTCARETGVILHATVTIGYDAPWRKIHELLLLAAGRTADLLKTPAPFVLQTALDDFYVHYEINVYSDQPNKMAAIYSELRTHIQDLFNEAGMEIMSPHFTSARDGNRIAIPDQYLPQSYEAPSFRIRPDNRNSSK